MKNGDQKIPVIRDQTLEHIARHLGDLGSVGQIVSWFRSWGVPRSLIGNPNTKWRMVFWVLRHYAYSNKEKGHKMLFKIIGEILHPLMYGGDKKSAEIAAENFNKFLEYDELAVLSGARNEYTVCETKNLIEITEEELLVGQQNDDVVEIRLKSGILTFNKNTGLVRLNKFMGNLNPQSKEFKVLLKLMTGKNYQATYADLLGQNATKVNKRNLTFVVRNLKEGLGILPAEASKNKDIIKNIKSHGYRLIL